MAEQIIQVPPDAGGKKVRTQEVVTGGNTVEMQTVVLGDPTNASNLALVSATGALKVDNSAVTQPVSGTFFQATQPVSLAGNVTVLQPTGSNFHANIDNFPATQPVSGTVVVSNFPATQPVSGTVSVTNFANPLPVTLTSTTVTNTVADNLSQIGGVGVSLGAKVSASSIPVVLATDEAALAVTGAFFQTTQPVSGTVTTTPPANASTNITQIGGSAVTLGSKISANSIPVVLASDEAALSITAASLPLPTGAATETTLSTRLADATFIGRINTQGQKAMVASTPVVLASDQSSIPVTGTFFQATQPISGTVSVTNFANPLPVTLASTTVTNTVAENLAQVGGAAVSLGAKTSANSIPVVLASDEAALSVTGVFFQATQPISGTISVSNFPGTQPISATTLPLPANAAQETGGNLAIVALQAQNNAQVLDILNEILGQLRLLNINLASSMPSAHVDLDSWINDSLPTFQ